jgi:TPR repeat protein
MRKKIFISSSSKDRKAALTICSAIEARGFACWISSRDIRPGENFQEAIVHAISDAGLMVLVFSANANNSSEIKKEIALASQSQLTVIPIRIEDVLPNAALRYEFATRQWIDVFGDWEQSMHELLAQIALAFPPEEAAPIVREMAKLEPVPQAQASQPVVKPVSSARQEKFAFAGKPYVIGGAALVLLLVAGGAFIFLRTPPQAPQTASAAQTQAQIESAQTQMDKGNASLYPAQPAQPQVPAQPAKKTAARQPENSTQSAAQSQVSAPPQHGGAAGLVSAVAAENVREGDAALRANDFAGAMQLYQLAAAHGSSKAELAMGQLYQNGKGVQQDYGQAMQWYQKAAAQGLPQAQTAIANLKSVQTAQQPQSAPAASASPQNQPASQLQASLQPTTPGASSAAQALANQDAVSRRPAVIFGCTEPTVPTPVDGAKLDRDQMIAALTEAKNYISASDVFQQCVNSYVAAQKTLAASKNQTLDQSIVQAAGDAISANQARKQQTGDSVNQAVAVYRSTHS